MRGVAKKAKKLPGNRTRAELLPIPRLGASAAPLLIGILYSTSTLHGIHPMGPIAWLFSLSSGAAFNFSLRHRCGHAPNKLRFASDVTPAIAGARSFNTDNNFISK
jgi:hypothetical protein